MKKDIVAAFVWMIQVAERWTYSLISPNRPLSYGLVYLYIMQQLLFDSKFESI
ncbi:hypothetical protein FACS189472_15220 [Alphaproteobacteria bacterium]|nr:hypothetical protein FACS189472_15220 [Alphaproteobacteria bacterium]